MSEFTGPATRFIDGAIAKAASEVGCDVAAIRAVIDVESKRSFQNHKRPKILFERHHFHRHTRGAHSASNPDTSSEKFGGYKGGAAEYERLQGAIRLDRAAALKSASWRAFQMLRSSHKAAGIQDVESFCAAMCQSEDDHLRAFDSFVKANHLDDEQRRRDWDGFARGYNGPNYRKYDEANKMPAAYTYHASVLPRADASPRRTLKMSKEGDDVEWLQSELGIRADGDFDPAQSRR